MSVTHKPINSINFDDEGYLLDSHQWNETVAQGIAMNDGVGKLSKSHFEVLQHLREHYYRTGSVPPLRVICHESHLGPFCINELFTSHGVEAWKIAGLPNPGEEVKAYM